MKHSLSDDDFNVFAGVAICNVFSVTTPVVGTVVAIVVATAAFAVVIIIFVSLKLGGCVLLVVVCVIFGFISNKLLTSFGNSQPCFGFISMANVSVPKILLHIFLVLSALLLLLLLLLHSDGSVAVVATVADSVLRFFC